MKTARPNPLALFFIGILPITFATAQDDPNAVAEKHFADLFYMEAHVDLAAELKDSGLSPADIQNTVDAIVNGAAHCSISAMIEKDDEISSRFLSAMALRLTGEEFEAELSDITATDLDDWIEELTLTLTACVYKIAQEAGYQITQ